MDESIKGYVNMKQTANVLFGNFAQWNYVNRLLSK